MPSASGRVFSIPELLLTILLELDMRTLLTTAQRIDRRFHAIINHTPAIRKALFLPHRGNGEKVVYGDDVIQNPLLVELFPPWFQEVGSHPTDYKTALTNLPMTLHNALPAFLHKEASWRHMLVQQPPILAVGLWEQLSHVRTDSHSFRVLARWSPDDDGGGDGLCMGALYDMIIRSTQGRFPEAFRVLWVGRGDLAYLERRPLAPQMTPQDRDEAARLVSEVGVLLNVYRHANRPFHCPWMEPNCRLWVRRNIESFKFPQRGGKGERMV